jgi:hypothetical protein
MAYPQGQTANLVVSSNYRQVGDTAGTANNGDVICVTPTTARTWNLPAIAPVTTNGVQTYSGAQGPVTVRVNAAFAVTVKTTDGSTIEGVAGATGVPFTGAAGASVGGTFVVDASGTNWVKVAS